MNLNRKNVLVTGADGFIGSHLVELQVQSGANVRALSYYNSFNYREWLDTHYREWLDTLGMIKKIMGPDVAFITDADRLRPKDSEVFRLCCDNNRIKQLTDFVPEYSLEQGLKQTIAWFSDPEHLRCYKTGMYNV